MIKHKTENNMSSSCLTRRSRNGVESGRSMVEMLGVWPMVIATGAACNSRISLGVPVFYGMLIGTAGGLLIIPLFYILVQTISEKILKKK